MIHGERMDRLLRGQVIRTQKKGVDGQDARQKEYLPGIKPRMEEVK